MARQTDYEGLKIVNMKVLVTGDPGGNLPALFKRVAAVNKSNGPFDLLFCVGSFFSHAGEARANAQSFFLVCKFAHRLYWHARDHFVQRRRAINMQTPKETRPQSALTLKHTLLAVSKHPFPRISLAASEQAAKRLCSLCQLPVPTYSTLEPQA